MTPKPSRKTTRSPARKPSRRSTRGDNQGLRAKASPTPKRTRTAKRATVRTTRKTSAVARRKAATARHPASRRRVTGKAAVRRRRKPSTAGAAAVTPVSARLHLMARDPHWLYAHWSLSSRRGSSPRSATAPGPLTLRVYQGETAGNLVKEVNLDPGDVHCFVPVKSGDTRFVAELGCHLPQGTWVSLARSSPVSTPPDTLATEETAVFATIPPAVAFQQIMRSLGPIRGGRRRTLLEAIEFLQAAGQGELPEGVAVGVVAEPWTPAQTRALRRLTGVEGPRRRRRRELASLAAAQIVPAETSDSTVSPTSPAGDWNGG